ncbi:MAG: hybrid-cluster NAD(P)-dependent oxidoreductase [Methylococcales bacterium]
MDNSSNAAPLWIEKLFKQSGSLSSRGYSKTYYTQLYRQKTTGHEFYKCLFTDLHKNPSEILSEAGSLNGLNAQVTSQFVPVPNALENNKQDRQYEVVNRFSETPDTVTFQLAKPSSEVFSYLPGQYVTLSLLIDGRRVQRSYSLSSTPSRLNTLEITVKRVANGVVSNWLYDNVHIGDSLNLRGPFGKFSCIDEPQDKLLFLAAGSGIVPIMSMLRWFSDTYSHKDIHVLLCFRTPEAIIYRNELKLLAARQHNMHISITLTAKDIEQYDWSGLTGRVSRQMLAELIPDLPERSVYLCGPDAFMAECKNQLLSLKLPEQRLHCEHFRVSKPSLVVVENQEIVKPAAHKVGAYQISFAKSGRKMTTDGQTSLLELAEQSGINISHQCRVGNCGECMIKCLAGTVLMSEQAEIDDFNKSRGWVYACCAYPNSNLVVDA